MLLYISGSEDHTVISIFNLQSPYPHYSINMNILRSSPRYALCIWAICCMTGISTPPFCPPPAISAPHSPFILLAFPRASPLAAQFIQWQPVTGSTRFPRLSSRPASTWETQRETNRTSTSTSTRVRGHITPHGSRQITRTKEESPTLLPLTRQDPTTNFDSEDSHRPRYFADDYLLYLLYNLVVTAISSATFHLPLRNQHISRRRHSYHGES